MPALASASAPLRLVSSSARALAPSARHLHKTVNRLRADTQLRIWQRKMEAKERYRDWTKESLLSRIAELEAQTTSLRAAQARVDTEKHVASLASTAATPFAAYSADADEAKGGGKKKVGKKEKKSKEFDFASSPCRKIALRFSYDGAGYSGLAAQNTSTPGSGSTLPTVEAVLWEALCMARLVDPAQGMDGAGFSRCGRTDRGVSAAGQVVALWVRSKKVNQWKERLAHQEQFATRPASSSTTPEELEELEAKRNARLEPTELPYVQILNRILPASIRIQAWSPVHANFSSRFDCTYRHYKYFFPAGPPALFFPPASSSPSSSSSSSSSSAAAANATIESGATRLDIARMRDAAARLLGEHDFRNLCKIDASKQITNYRRRIDGVSIDRVSSHWPSRSVRVADAEEEGEREDMYVLNLRGTAFLYHQVRNIMAILFLVGARLEHPSVVEELMNTERGQIAADRVKMRLAAGTALRPTANSAPAPADDASIKWWLPVNATSSSGGVSHADSPAAAQPAGLPMWLVSALNTDSSAHAASDAALEVYATKPNYEMAADRPLVLWECGFLPSDIEWRVGSYDGALASIPATAELENWTMASHSLLRVHKTWTQLAISTELSRHFVLASPSAHVGSLPSRTDFEQASFPALPTIRSTAAGGAGVETTAEPRGGEKRRGAIPLGNGTGRGAANYIPLKQRPREEPYEVKNRRWAETTGRRRAERKEAERNNSAQHDE